MRAPFAYGIVLILLVTVAGPSNASQDSWTSSAELLQNPGFEFGSVAGASFGWSPATGTSLALRTSNPEPHSGSFSVVVAEVGIATPILTSNLASLKPGFLVLEAFVKDSVDPVDVAAEFFSASGASLGVFSTGLRAPALAWTKVSTNITIPAGATKARAVILSNGITESQVDDVSLVNVRPPTTPGVLLWSETFESGLSAWSVTGASAVITCAQGNPGCSLALDPEMGQPFTLSVERPVGVALSAPVTVSVDFSATSTTGSSDTHLWIVLPSGVIEFDISAGTSGNNGIRLRNALGDTGLFYQWPLANTWYTAVIRLDPVADTAQADILSADGTWLASSAAIPIWGADQTIDAMRFVGVDYSSGHLISRWDNLKVKS